MENFIHIIEALQYRSLIKKEFKSNCYPHIQLKNVDIHFIHISTALISDNNIILI